MTSNSSGGGGGSGSISRLLTGGDCPQGLVDTIECWIANCTLANGFKSIDYASLRILTNLFISTFESIAVSALAYAESTNRSSVVLPDIILALLDSGFKLDQFDNIPGNRLCQQLKGDRRSNKPNAAAPSFGVAGSGNQAIIDSSHRPANQQPAPILGPNGLPVVPRSILLTTTRSSSSDTTTSSLLSTHHRIGSSSSHQRSHHPTASYGGIVNKQLLALTSTNPHLLPTLPDLPEPHTFMRTRLRRPPLAIDLSGLRKRQTDQRRRLQRSFVKFVSRLRPSHSLFPSDQDSFTLVLPQETELPYLAALTASSTPATIDAGNIQDGGGVTSTVKPDAGQSQQPQLSDQTLTNLYLAKTRCI